MSNSVFISQSHPLHRGISRSLKILIHLTALVILTSCYGKFDEFDCLQNEDGCAGGSSESSFFVSASDNINEGSRAGDSMSEGGEDARVARSGRESEREGGQEGSQGGQGGQVAGGGEGDGEGGEAGGVDPVEPAGSEVGAPPSSSCGPATCEPIDCAAFVTYEIVAVSDTEAQCDRIFHTAQAERCVDGRCATRDEYCIESSREVERSSEELGECGAINGCINEVPSSITGRNVGGSCANGGGVCNQGGQCTANNCGFFDITGGRLCFDQSRVNGRCSFDVSFGAGVGLALADHCDELCIDSGGVCIGSYADKRLCYDGGNGNGEELSCDLQRSGDRVCICEYIY